MANSTKFNGKTFELVLRRNVFEKDANIKSIENGLEYYGNRTLAEVYANHSMEKEIIWNSWVGFFNGLIYNHVEIKAVEYGITGANKFCFIISAHIIFNNGEHYYMKITPSRNRLYYYHD